MPNFECKDTGDDSIELLMYGPIATDFWGDGTVVDPRAVAKALSEHKSAKTITLRVNSPGGNAFHAFAIYESLKNTGAKIKSLIEGIAASAMSIVIMASDEIAMNSAGLLMIHRSSVGAVGHAEDLRQTAEIADKIDQNQVKIFAARTGLPEAEVVAMLYAETWMTAEEALSKKFISSISQAKTVAAHFGDETFTNVPERVRPLLASLQQPVGKNAPMAQEAPKPAETPAAVVTPAVVAPVVTTPVAPAAAATPAATPATPAIPPVQPAEPVDVAAVSKKVAAEAIAEERQRCADINALCSQAGKADLAAGFIQGPDTVADVRTKLFTALCNERPPVGPEAEKPVDKSATAKGDAKFAAEYDAEPEYAKVMTKEEYIAMRRIDTGEDELKAGTPTEQPKPAK